MATLSKAVLEPPAMTHCECAELDFAEIRDRLETGQSLEEIMHRTGCGSTCTACLPDLRAFLEGGRSSRSSR
jgi:bacterioferritin-associated ferredoxin